jgi:hypothetical protein
VTRTHAQAHRPRRLKPALYVLATSYRLPAIGYELPATAYQLPHKPGQPYCDAIDGFDGGGA